MRGGERRVLEPKRSAIGRELDKARGLPVDEPRPRTETLGPEGAGKAEQAQDGEQKARRRKGRAWRTDRRSPSLKDRLKGVLAFRWTDRTIIFQIMCSVSLIFSVYAIAYIIQLLVSVDGYREKLVRRTTEVIAEEAQHESDHVMKSAVAQANFYLDLTQQLIEKQSRVILDALDDRGEFDIHPIDFGPAYPVSLTVARQYPAYQGIAFHKEILQLPPAQRDQAQRLVSLNLFYE